MTKPKKNKKSALAKTAAILGAGAILTATGVYLSKHQLASLWQLHPVSKVIDGDTIKVDTTTSVRLIGIDSPEPGQCFSAEARQALTDLLAGKKVYLEKEISGVDEYGRLLRYVFLPAADKQDNLLVNDYLVRHGFAQAAESPPDSRYRDLFNSAQEQAIRDNLGLWAKCDYEDQLSERREHNDPAPNSSYVVKGNISTRGYGKTYLIPGCDNYNNVKIDLAKGETYFQTAAQAEKAGFRKATNCP